MKKWRIGVDVGGTNTDAVLIDEYENIISTAKTPTTADVTTGIIFSIRGLLGKEFSPKKVAAVMIGTTHLLNALLQRKSLEPVMVIRLANTTDATPPGIGWSRSLRESIIGEHQHIVSGGYEYNGDEMAPLDEAYIKELAEKALSKKIFSVAVTGVFSHVRPDQELRVREIFLQTDKRFKVSLSHQLGTLGLLTRENATIMNASLAGVYNELCHAIQSVLQQFKVKTLLGDSWVDAKTYLSNSIGTVQPLEDESSSLQAYPILALDSGRTNSIRGAAVVAGMSHAVVVDVGGTSTDIGIVKNDFPIMENAPFSLTPDSDIICQFPKPRVESIGLGGGSCVVINDDDIQIGPQSVGHELDKSISFGGDVLTLTDVGILLDRLPLTGQVSKKDLYSKLQKKYGNGRWIRLQVRRVDEGLEKVLESIDREMHKMVAGLVREVLASIEDKPETIILVGGGAQLFDQKHLSELFDNEFTFSIPKHADVANATGAAIAQTSVQVTRLYDYSKFDRSFAIISVMWSALQDMLEKSVSLRSIAVGGMGFQETALDYLSGSPTELSIELVGQLEFLESPQKKESLQEAKEHLRKMLLSIGIDKDISDIKLVIEQLEKVKPVSPSSRKKVSKSASHDLSMYRQAAPLAAPAAEMAVRRLPDKELTKEDINHIALGAAFLGSGGGGSPELGRLMTLSQLQAGKTVRMIKLKDLPDDALVVAFGVMGSPIVLSERLISEAESLHVIQAIQSTLGKPLDAIVIMEGGGTNATYPLYCAAQLGIPVVNADCMGRAFPGINMVTPNVYGHFDTNVAFIANSQGVFTVEQSDFSDMEDQARGVTVDAGGIVSLAYLPMSGAQMKQWCMPDTLTIARDIGRAYSTGEDKLLEMNRVLKNTPYGSLEKIASGRIINIARKEIDGFSVGAVIIASTDQAGIEQQYEVGFQNENLFVRRPFDNKDLVEVPDLIILGDANTLRPISCEELRYGKMITIMKMESPQRLKAHQDPLINEKLKNVFGRSAFQIDKIKELIQQIRGIQIEENYFVSELPPLKNAILLVSLAQNYSEGVEMKAILDHLRWLKSRNKVSRLGVVVADTLQKYNALDPHQIARSRVKDERRWWEAEPVKQWQIRLVEHSKDLLGEIEPGEIRVFISEQSAEEAVLEYRGSFGEYSFIYKPQILNVALKKNKSLRYEDTEKVFLGKVIVCSDLLQNISKVVHPRLLDTILTQAARNAGEEWVQRNIKSSTAYADIEILHWSLPETGVLDAGLEKLNELCQTDPIFLLLVMRKVATYKQKRSDGVEAKFWKNARELIKKAFLSKNIEKFLHDPSGRRDNEFNRAFSVIMELLKQDKGYLEYIRRYILVETAVFMYRWGEDGITEILYRNDELLYHYMRTLGGGEQFPKWVPYQPEPHNLKNEICRRVFNLDLLNQGSCYIPQVFQIRKPLCYREYEEPQTVSQGCLAFWDARDGLHYKTCRQEMGTINFTDFNDEFYDMFSALAAKAGFDLYEWLKNPSNFKIQDEQGSDKLTGESFSYQCLEGFRSRNVIVYGESGRGKSVWSRVITRKLINEYDLTILISPQDFNKKNSLPDNFDRYLEEVLQLKNEELEYWNQKIRNGSLLVVLDSYDQFVDKQRVDRLLKSIWTRCVPHSRSDFINQKFLIIVTSNSKDIRPEHESLPFHHELELMNVNPEDVCQYLMKLPARSLMERRKVVESIRRNKAMMQLAVRPVFLQIIADTINKKHSDFSAAPCAYQLMERQFFDYFESAFQAKRGVYRVQRIRFRGGPEVHETWEFKVGKKSGVFKNPQGQKQLFDPKICSKNWSLHYIQPGHKDDNSMPPMDIYCDFENNIFLIEGVEYSGPNGFDRKFDEQYMYEVGNHILQIIQRKKLYLNHCLRELAKCVQQPLPNFSQSEFRELRNSIVHGLHIDDPRALLSKIEVTGEYLVRSSDLQIPQEGLLSYLVGRPLLTKGRLQKSFSASILSYIKVLEDISEDNYELHDVFRAFLTAVELYYNRDQLKCYLEFISSYHGTNHYLVLRLLFEKLAIDYDVSQEKELFEIMQKVVALPLHDAQSLYECVSIFDFMWSVMDAHEGPYWSFRADFMDIMVPRLMNRDQDERTYKRFSTEELCVQALRRAADVGIVSALEILLRLSEHLGIDHHKIVALDLHYIAVRHGNLEVIKYLGERYPGILETTGKGDKTFLHYVCYYGHKEIAEYVVEKTKGKHLNAKSRHNETALCSACKGGHLELAKWLYEQSKCLQEEVASGRINAFWMACYHDRPFFLQWLLSLNSLMSLTYRDVHGNTLMHVGCKQGHLNIVKILYQKLLEIKTQAHSHGSPFEPNTKTGQTVLHAACHGGLEMVKWVVDKEPSLLLNVDSQGNNVQHEAAKLGRIDVIKWLDIQCEIANDTRMYMSHDLDYVPSEKDRIFVRINEHYMEYNESGYLPVHVACCEGHLDVVRYLCDNDRGHHHYDIYSEKHVVTFLLSARDSHGRTPWQLAALNNHGQMAKYFIESVKETDFWGRGVDTIVYYACVGGSVEWMRSLLAIIRKRSNAGHRLAYADYPEEYILDELINGLNVLSLAAAMGHLELVQFLCENVPELLQLKAGIVPPISVAIQFGDRSMVCYFLLHTPFSDVKRDYYKDFSYWPIQLQLSKLDDRFMRGKSKSKKNKQLCREFLNKYELYDKEIEQGHANRVLELIIEDRSLLNNVPAVTQAFYMSCMVEHFELASLLLQHNKNLTKMRIKEGRTMLHIAVENDRPKLVSYLFRHGADPDARDAWGYTPLSVAINRCQESYEATEQLLLSSATI